MVDVATYGLWQKADQTSLEVKQLRDALSRATFAHDPTFRFELDQIQPKTREDSTTLSEKRRLELMELLVSYSEPLMDRHEHDTYLQQNRKYLERLANFQRRDALIRGTNPKGINAEDMAPYSFAHAARGLGSGPGPGAGLSCNKGIDPQTGKYSIILKYEGSLEVAIFKRFIRRYPSSQKIDLYETLKSLFAGGQEYGLTKLQLGEVLINILATREVRESSDTLEANIYRQTLGEDPHGTITCIIQMVSRNTQQAYVVRERIAKYRRPVGLPIENCINTLGTLCEEFFRHSHPGLTISARKQKVDQSLVKMLPDIVDSDVARQLKLHKKENNNNGIENSLENLRRFLSKIEGDRRHAGGQKVSRDGLSSISFFNNDKKDDRSRTNKKWKERKVKRRFSRSSSTEGERRNRFSDSTSRSRSASSSRRPSRSSTRSVGTSTATSRASSVHSNFSEPNVERRKKTERRPRKKEQKKVTKKDKSHYSSHEKKRDERRSKGRSTSGSKLCPLCYQESCSNTGTKRCPLRPNLVYNKERNGYCMVCKRGYHYTIEECLRLSEKKALKARQEEERGSRERSSSPAKN